MNYELSYEHQLTHSYMILTRAFFDSENYENKMLLSTRIPGTIPFSLCFSEEEPCLRYNISSVRAMTDFFEGRRLNYTDIAQIMSAIRQQLSIMESYLLPEHLILLSPETIFMDEEQSSCLFTLIPECTEDFSASLCRLLHWILERIDYRSDRTVILAYTLFQEASKKLPKIEELMRIVRTNLEKAQQEASPSSASEHSSGEAADSGGGPLLSPEGVFRLPDAAFLTRSSASGEAPAAPEKEEQELFHFSVPAEPPSIRPEDYAEELTCAPPPEKERFQLPRGLPLFKRQKADSLSSSEEQKKKKAGFRKLLLCLFLMPAIPALFYFLRGLPFLQKQLPLILILEFGILVVAILDYMMLHLPEDPS